MNTNIVILKPFSTGLRLCPEIIDAADLVTVMTEVKHYYYQGVMARDGIEK